MFASSFFLSGCVKNTGHVMAESAVKRADAEPGTSPHSPAPPPSKLVISGLALVPFALAAAVILFPMYIRSGGLPLFGQAWKDVLACFAALMTFFCTSLLLMFVRLPV